MGRLIGHVKTSNLGERLFIEKAIQYLDDSCIIYWNRQIFGREFDVCLVIPGKGLIVVEVKGWREESVIRVEENQVVIKASDGQTETNPQKQARGYRYALETLIRQKTGRFPLVLHMVSLPQISSSFFRNQRLDTVMEESLTFLAEDLADNAAFFRKLNSAFHCSTKWTRDPFDNKTMRDVRRIFEPDVDGDSHNGHEETHTAIESRDYSRFYYFSSDTAHFQNTIREIADFYMAGCKLNCVFSSEEQMRSALNAVDQALRVNGLRRKGNTLDRMFDETEENQPPATAAYQSVSGFHFSFSVLQSSANAPQNDFCVIDGQVNPQTRKDLVWLSNHSDFNVEQYLVEHADVNKNIMIRAGAGTGKTYTMISRIAYLCHQTGASFLDMTRRIMMITFTDEAAEQMAARLKAYFRNRCLLSNGHRDAIAYLRMVAQIDQMQICTIHAYAKQLIGRLGAQFGYGVDVSVTSGDYLYREIISDLLDQYIARKTREYGRDFVERLRVPVYAIRDDILGFVTKLHSQNVSLCDLERENFGLPSDASRSGDLHALFSDLIPLVEREYRNRTVEENRIHLGSIMSSLSQFLRNPASTAQLAEMGTEETRFLFVDEFQDTDDIQIEIILKIAEALHEKMFLVGDIKQCIYRFRGAEEKAFDRVGVLQNPSEWLQFSLRRNYRTDRFLLDLYDRAFVHWNENGMVLLDYHEETDRLIGTCDYNSYMTSRPNWQDKIFTRIEISRESERIPSVVQEIRRLQIRLQYEAQKGIRTSRRERTIAVLVRENWQAEEIRRECAKSGIRVRTKTGGDLYTSQPALDMMTLVNALVHFDEADYLYAFLSSNFFQIVLPKSSLHEQRQRIKAREWKSEASERDMVNHIMSFMRAKLSNLPNASAHWENVVQNLRDKPVLQVMRELYDALEPWKKYADGNLWKERWYQMNVDLLFEQMVNSCGTDSLTINTLQTHLFHSIISQTPVDTRRPPGEDETDASVECITVHKSKGLEYGHVILPYGSFPMDSVKSGKIQVNVSRSDDLLRIGYCVYPDDGPPVSNTFYDDTVEAAEKSREEARILYVAMTRAIRSFSWVSLKSSRSLSWQSLIERGASTDAIPD